MNALIENPVTIQFVVFVLVVALFTALGSLKAGREIAIESRVRNLGTREHFPTQHTPGRWSLLKAKIPKVTQSALLNNEKQKSRLQKRFLEAGIYHPWAVTLYIAVRFGSSIALPTLFIAIVWVRDFPVAKTLLCGALALLLGLCLPPLWLEHRRARRQFTLRRAIPDFLDLIVACLGGGLSVQAALRQVTDELRLAHPDLSGELSMVLREIELGGTLDHALHELASRTGMDELRTLRSFVHQTTKFGTTITDALGQLADMLRMQREQRAEELAQKAAVKILFPTVLFIFPTIFVVLAGPAALQIKKGFKSSTHQQHTSQQR